MTCTRVLQWVVLAKRTRIPYRYPRHHAFLFITRIYLTYAVLPEQMNIPDISPQSQNSFRWEMRHGLYCKVPAWPVNTGIDAVRTVLGGPVLLHAYSSRRKPGVDVPSPKPKLQVPLS